MREWMRLGKAANNLAASISAPAVAKFASDLQTFQGESAHSGYSPDHWTLEIRQECREFLAAWKTEFPSVPAAAVAAALWTAAEAAEAYSAAGCTEVVWTGPESPLSCCRHTEQAALEIIDTAKERVLIVCYAVYRIPRICAALERAAGRGVQIDLVVETPDLIEGQGDYDTLRALSHKVTCSSAVYYWPRANRPMDASGRVGLLHVKCLIGDSNLVLISSANLTEYAFTTNMELGVLIRSGSIAHQIENQIAGLISAGIVERIDTHNLRNAP